MKLKKVASFFSMSLAIVIGVAMLSSCTCKVKDDQLAKLAELRRQEKSLNSEAADKQSAKAKIDQELQARTSEYNDCENRKEIVKQRLAVWPNIWPDYTPKP